MQEQASGFFFVSFYSASCLSLEDLVQRCLGQPVDLLAPWSSAAVIPRRRSTAVYFQSVERRVQRNLEGLVNVRFNELPGCRAATLTFFNAYAEERTLREGRQNSPLAAPPLRCMQKRDSMSVPRDTQKCEQEDWAATSRFRLRKYRTVQTRPVSSRSAHHGIFPYVYFYTNSLQRLHERRPMASRREQVSALFFVAWTQRRLTECFPGLQKGQTYPRKH